MTKDKERAAEVKQREQGLNDSFSKQTGKKLAEKLESAEDRKNAHLKSVQDRLQEHVSEKVFAHRVQELNRVQKSSI